MLFPATFKPLELTNSMTGSVLATLLVMGFFVRKGLQSNSAYELVYDKADAWAMSQLPQMGEFGQIIGRRKAEIMALV